MSKLNNKLATVSFAAMIAVGMSSVASAQVEERGANITEEMIAEYMANPGAFASAAQAADSLPVEATDEILDMIVTEQGVFTP